MKGITKYFAGAAGAAALAVAAASPAQAEHRDRNGIDAGDIVTGVAVIGGIAALIAALDGDNDRYDRRYDRRYDSRYDRNNGRYGSGYGYDSPEAAVNLCAREAQRYGGNVQITDLDREDGYYRVRGRVDVRDYDYGRYGRRSYDVDRERFTCFAANGRVYDFRV